VFRDVGMQVVADRVGIPAGVAQQPLHRPGPGETGLFGQLSAVLPLHARRQPEQVGAARRAGLNPPEPAQIWAMTWSNIAHQRAGSALCRAATARSSGVRTHPDDQAMAVPVPHRVRDKLANPD
jgi:hypothetical protein